MKSPTTATEATQQQGLNYSQLGCPNPPTRTPETTKHIGGFAPRAEFVLIQSCGYACFGGLFGRLAGVWRVFEVVLQLRNFRGSNGVVARVQSIRDNMQVIGLNIVVRSLIRNTFVLDFRL